MNTAAFSRSKNNTRHRSCEIDFGMILRTERFAASNYGMGRAMLLFRQSSLDNSNLERNQKKFDLYIVREIAGKKILEDFELSRLERHM